MVHGSWKFSKQLFVALYFSFISNVALGEGGLEINTSVLTGKHFCLACWSILAKADEHFVKSELSPCANQGKLSHVVSTVAGEKNGCNGKFLSINQRAYSSASHPPSSLTRHSPKCLFNKATQQVNI